MTQFQAPKQNCFYYFLCNIGSEKFLKEEIRLLYPELAFSFSLPGFLTFKELRPLGKTLRPVFCRHFGRFIKKGSSEELKLELGNEQYSEYNLKGEILRNEFPLKYGSMALELIHLDEKTSYLGEYIVSELIGTVPGGFSNEILPDNSPSRAYLKVLDALKYVRVELKKGERALEIGSSPGGATLALLNLGFSVEGVDPGEMSEVCLNHPMFFHHHQSIQEFHVSSLKGHIEWLFVDMNLAPEATLREIEKVVEKIKPSLKGAFITIKMTKFELVSRVPMYLNLVHKMGLKVVTATQLPSHKQEFLIYALK